MDRLSLAAARKSIENVYARTSVGQRPPLACVSRAWREICAARRLASALDRKAHVMIFGIGKRALIRLFPVAMGDVALDASHAESIRTLRAHLRNLPSDR